MSKESDQRLSQIATSPELIQAHERQTTSARDIRSDIWQRFYAGPVYRYLRAVVGDDEVAQDLSNDIWKSLLSGDFRGFDRSRGNFRKYLKTVLSNRLNDYYRHQNKRPASLDALAAEPAARPLDTDSPDFDNACYREVLDQAWRELKSKHPGFDEILRLQREVPGMNSAEMAERLAAQHKEPVATDTVRKRLQRARQKIRQLVVCAVEKSLPDPDLESIELELKELGLLSYCKEELERRKNPTCEKE